MVSRPVLACLVALTLGAGTPAPGRAAAPAGPVSVALHDHYDVYYWVPGHRETRKLKGAYKTLAAAAHEAEHLREMGFSTEIVEAG